MNYRLAGSFVVAAGISLALFWLIQYALKPSTDNTAETSEYSRMVDFIRLKPKTHEENLRQRKRPEPPKPQQPPQSRQKIQQLADAPTQPVSQPQMPRIKFPIETSANISSGLSTTMQAPQKQYSIATNLIPIFKTPPRYPRRASRMGIEGSVTLEFTITTEGDVTDIEVVKSEPESIFDRSALRALKQWRFKPAVEDGKAIEQRARQVIKYELD